MARTDRDILADAIEEIDDRLGRIESLLVELKKVCVDAVDGQSELRAHANDGFDRLGTRTFNNERRLSALEALVPRVANGGE